MDKVHDRSFKRKENLLGIELVPRSTGCLYSLLENRMATISENQLKLGKALQVIATRLGVDNLLR